MDSRKDILDKAKKLEELAIRGVGGERDNAKTFLISYKKKHAISDQELRFHRQADEFKNVSVDDFLNGLAQELFGIGLQLFRAGIRAIIGNSDKLNKMASKEVPVTWEYDPNTYTYTGRIGHLTLFDIQETRKGCTLYKCANMVDTPMSFLSIILAKEFCELLAVSYQQQPIFK